MEAMTLRRGRLYSGVFLIAVGAVAVLDAAGVLDTPAVGRALVVLWPLALIAVGLWLAVRRTPAALPAGLLAAMLPGLALGGTVVSAPRFADGCTGLRPVASAADSHAGTLASAATVDLTLDCGRLDVTTQLGSDWRLDAREDGTVPRTLVQADATRLTADTGSHTHAGLHAGAVDWSVVLPTGPVVDLRAQINAGHGSLALGQAHLGALDLAVNAGDLDVDLTGATLERLAVTVNAGRAAVTLPAAASFGGTLDANAGALTVCAPDQLGLRVRSTTTLGSSTVNGLVRRGDAWETPDYATAPYQADLSVRTSIGSVAVNPQGGCK
jgi:hypothetical protein